MRRVLIPGMLDALPPLPAAGATVETLAGETMGTRWRVKFVPCTTGGPALATRIQAVLDGIVAQMSTWQPDSELSRFNDAPAGHVQILSAAFTTVLDAALQLAVDSGGAYDPTAGALVDLWGFGPAPPRRNAPEVAQIDAACARGGWSRLRFDRACAAATQPGGLRLDLSSIAKGYAVDRVCQLLTDSGIDHALVEIGGELRGRGCKPDGQPWWVDLERTVDDVHFTPLRVALHGLAIATSGDARRFFSADGRRYSHTIDPRSGWPIDEAVASVTVLHPSCMLADGLATAIAVLGPLQGLAFAQCRGVAARLVERAVDGCREHLTPAFRQMLE